MAGLALPRQAMLLLEVQADAGKRKQTWMAWYVMAAVMAILLA